MDKKTEQERKQLNKKLMKRTFVGEMKRMKNEKVDKGFELSYYRLSYRRRFIRTLWMIPWMFLGLFLMYWSGATAYILVPTAIIFAIVGYIQAYHNYKKWKEEEENGKKI